MARDAPWERKLQKQLPQTGLVAADVVVDLTVRPLEVGVSDDCRPPVARTRNIDHVEVVLADHAVEVRVDEILSGRGSPVAEYHALDVRKLQRPGHQRIVAQVEL